MKVAVIGTGYVGLVHAATLAEMGHEVVCIDKDPKKIERLRAADVPFFEPGLAELIESNRGTRLAFQSSEDGLPQEAIRDAEVIFVAVGTPSRKDGSADLTALYDVIDAIGENVNPDRHTVIAIKSTVPPGTARDLHQRIRSEGGNATIVSNPEFLKEGDAVRDSMRPDRIVIGVDTAFAGSLAVETMERLYAPFVLSGRPIIVCSNESAELAKYAANAHLAVRVTLQNELARIAQGVGANILDVQRVVAADSRIGPAFLHASIGWGGSCFPKDLAALSYVAHEVDADVPVIDVAPQSNVLQQEEFARMVAANVKPHSKIAVWGMAFKPNTDDMRDSPTIRIVRELADRGFYVTVHDPQALDNVARIFEGGRNVHINLDEYDALQGATALLLLTEWNQYRAPDFRKMRDLMHLPMIFDGRNLWAHLEGTLRELKFSYTGIGR